MFRPQILVEINVFDGFWWMARGGLPPFSLVPGGPGQLPFGCAGVLRVDRVRRGGVDLRERRKPYGNQCF